VPAAAMTFMEDTAPNAISSGKFNPEKKPIQQ